MLCEKVLVDQESKSNIRNKRSINEVNEISGTHSREGIVQVVNGPGNDHNVIDIQPEGQNSSSQADTWKNGNVGFNCVFNKLESLRLLCFKTAV